MYRAPIHVASASYDVEALRRELATGVSPDERGGVFDVTPLHCLCSSLEDHSDEAAAACCRLLVEAGANVNARDSEGNSVLIYATVWTNHINTLEFLLLLRGADVHATGANLMTPLHCAAYRNSPDAIVLLLRVGAAVNTRDADDQTPLEFAIKNGNRSIYPVLLRAGSALPTETTDPYLRAVLDAGSFQRYEHQHLEKLAVMLTPKSPPEDGQRRSRRRLSPLRRIPHDVIRKIAAFAFHAGCYVC